MIKRNQQFVKDIKKRIVLCSKEEELDLVFDTKDKVIYTIDKDNNISERYMNYKEDESIRCINRAVSRGHYKVSITSYSNEIRNNVIPITFSIIKDDKWYGKFINLDNGNVYSVRANTLNKSKYKYEFRTLYFEVDLNTYIHGTQM